MFEETQEKNDQLKQVIKEIDKNSTEQIELPDSVIASIVGGTYLKAKVAANSSRDNCSVCLCECI